MQNVLGILEGMDYESGVPRSARLDAPGVLHDVMGRGIEKRKIFINDKDRRDFIGRLEGLAEDHSLKIYAWALRSGHSALIGKVKRVWQDTGYVLSYFGKGLGGRKNYLKFVEEGISLGRRPEMVGGGLIRSLGGWSSVLALRRRGGVQASDQRILGDGDFVEAVLSEMDEVGKENLRLKYPKKDLSLLASKVCRFRGVALTELKSGSRRHEVVKAGRELSPVAVKLFGYSGAEVARYLGVASSCVTREVSLKEISPEMIERYGANRE